jgi:hypothetical protein
MIWWLRRLKDHFAPLALNPYFSHSGLMAQYRL